MLSREIVELDFKRAAKESKVLIELRKKALTFLD
jgi:hypothetical protein